MTLTVEATYERGVLRPFQPLPLEEIQRLKITLDAEDDWVEETYGILGWTGDAETVRRVALDPELGIEECP